MQKNPMRSCFNIWNNKTEDKGEDMSIVKIRNLNLGDEQAKICVPLVGQHRTQLEAQLAAIQKHEPDMVEFRGDHFEAVREKARLKEVLKMVRDCMGDTALLFTFRTKEEGGEKTISYGEYAELLEFVADTGYVDAVDVEVYKDEDETPTLIRTLREKGMVVIGSNHHFEGTPSKEKMLRLLTGMQQAGADIAKLAVMPKQPEDVMRLLNVTIQMKMEHADTPIITMAIGKLGVNSRLSGSLIGNSLTFASVARQSAPGQVEIEALREVLTLTQ